MSEKLSDVVSEIVSAAKAFVADTNSDAYEQLGVWLVDIILSNHRYEQRVVDCGYDVSYYPYRIDEAYPLEDYDTVGDFLDHELTGNTVATYCSGSGIAPETLRAAAQSLAAELFSEWIYARFPVLRLDNVEEPAFESDDIWDVLFQHMADDSALMETFAHWNLAEVCVRYVRVTLAWRDEVRRQEEQTARQQGSRLAEVQKLGAASREYIRRKFKGRHFEKKNWMELLTVLAELAQQENGFNSVGAALEIRPWPFTASNSVSAELKRLYPYPAREKK